MDKPNRKITWVHVTYLEQGEICITFVTERWKNAKYLGKRKKVYLLVKRTWSRMAGLLRVLRQSPNSKYTIVSWDGWSICYERLFS